jgi:hypothetical protein
MNVKSWPQISGMALTSGWGNPVFPSCHQPPPLPSTHLLHQGLVSPCRLPGAHLEMSLIASPGWGVTPQADN